MPEFFHGALVLLVVILLFNLIIFVHELGHFLAARWRGLQIDRFQVWFGKPIWKKTVNGVQYGLGWLPAGGFVALPQMAPMESIEGKNGDGRALPPVKPIDKIIVAFAGPLFSLLLALLGGLIVWGVGKPRDIIPTTVVGAVMEDSPAEKAGFQPGDRILTVDGESVPWFQGDFAGVVEKVMLTKSEKIAFEVERDGKPLTLTSSFDLPQTAWYQRRGLPQVGIAPASPVVIGSLLQGNNPGPAERAGLKVGDEIIEIDGEKIYGTARVMQILKKKGENPIDLTVKRGGKMISVTLTPLVPEGDFYEKPMVGIGFDPKGMVETKRLYPNPIEQVRDSLRQMWLTISSVASPKSNIGVDQLAGPVGIATMKYKLLMMEDGWARIMAFFVLFNVNLAVLNMLPFPVLDGGHVLMALSEIIARKPLPARFLEVVQTAFALVLMGFFFFVTTKDFGALVPGEKEEKAPPLVWPAEPSGEAAD